MKIKVKLFNKECKFEFIKKGEWIDLRAAEDVVIEGPHSLVLDKTTNRRKVVFSTHNIPLGIGMKLPKGIEAQILPRSSTYKDWFIMMRNSKGIIDCSYSGPNDQWKFAAIAMDTANIKKGDKICQFRLQLSQKATVWQKIKWLFTNKIEFEFVDDYDGVDRGGFGSTGKN